MNFLSLFTGVGGLDLGLERAGFHCVGQVEIDEYCRKVLTRHWPEVPRHDDVATCVDWWQSIPRPPVHLVAGGPPCQPVSYAGRRKGQTDERWLWPAMWAVIAAIRPRYVIIENVPGLFSYWPVETGDPRCLCGRYRRRRGLHIYRSDKHRTERLPLCSPHRRWDGSEKPAITEKATQLARRFITSISSRNPEMGSSLDMDTGREEGRHLSASDTAIPSIEGGAGQTRDPSCGDSQRVASEPGRSGYLVAGGTSAVRRDPPPHTRTQQERSGAARTAARIFCPACGRRMGDRPVRPVLRSGISTLLETLATLGYDCEWDCIPAAAVGAPHRRDRIFLVAYPGRVDRRLQPVTVTGGGGTAIPGHDGQDRAVADPDGQAGRSETGCAVTTAGDAALPLRPEELGRCGGDVADTDGHGRNQRQDLPPPPGRHDRTEPAGSGPTVADSHGPRRGPWEGMGRSWPTPVRDGWWDPQPPVDRNIDGFSTGVDRADVAAWERGIPRTAPTTPDRVNRIRALGNAVVPQVGEHVGRVVTAIAAAREGGPG